MLVAEGHYVQPRYVMVKFLFVKCDLFYMYWFCFL